MNKNLFLDKIQNDVDFIAIKRFEFSLEKLLERYPNGCPAKVIAQALLITETELEVLEQQIVSKLREKML